MPLVFSAVSVARRLAAGLSGLVDVTFMVAGEPSLTNVDGHCSRAVAIDGAVVGLVGEAISPPVLVFGVVGERTVGVEIQSAVARSRDVHCREGIPLDVAVVTKHTGSWLVEHGVITGAVGVLFGNRRLVARRLVARRLVAR